MNTHPIYDEHQHEHSLSCGHTKILHQGHVDYVHKGHLYHEHEDHWDECKIEVSDLNPDGCHPVACMYKHDEDCGHEMVPHGDHMDYFVNGRFHHAHGDHCDDHDPVEIVTQSG